MDSSKINIEHVMAAYARARLSGRSFGSVGNTQSIRKLTNGATKGTILVQKTITAAHYFDPGKIAAALFTADRMPVTMQRIVTEWVNIAFDPNADRPSRMRALEKVEKILVATAAMHPVIEDELKDILPELRKAARQRAGRKAAEPAQPATDTQAEIPTQEPAPAAPPRFIDFVKGKTG